MEKSYKIVGKMGGEMSEILKKQGRFYLVPGVMIRRDQWIFDECHVVDIERIKLKE